MTSKPTLTVIPKPNGFFKTKSTTDNAVLLYLSKQDLEQIIAEDAFEVVYNVEEK